MTTTNIFTVTAHIPAHVPPELVRDFDFARDLSPGDPYLNLKKLHDGPDIFYTSCREGHWVVTRYDDMERIVKNPDDFSSEEMVIPKVEKPLRLIPIETNPPLHTEYRAIVQPFLSPKRIGDLEARTRELTLALMDSFYAKGECEFVSEFALKMPIEIFLNLVDLPSSDAPLLIELVDQYINGVTAEKRQVSFCQIAQYLGQKLAERRNNLGDDMLSAILSAKIEGGRSLTDSEVLGFAIMVLAGGIETVAGALSTTVWYLAQNDAHRRLLTEQPAMISVANEELLRRYHGVMFPRMVKRDLVFNGVTMKAGELVFVPVALGGIDERHYPDPFTVDFDRKDKKHLAFGAGPHTCIGSFLARTELRIFLTEWLKKIPDFSIKAGTTPVMHVGQNIALGKLYLTWPAA